ncbi:methyl-accepting chemotaxis protein [Oceanirhabdus seepicola]|uniref:Methyl-accepting chemotaxis protein n=1 Tax=Oceanirhabdus seepicola TaxID=2828781 RepID=A0A9J6P297_9CLOT|nr:methyl-accepting chemotaxis protein [Oceanirhabdus seepicola]MCM1990643.1 methyl-accepting chemotaxis protein [Oceanirhabdus seepicola]
MIKKMKISTRLIASFLVIIVLCAVLGLSSISALKTLEDLNTKMYENSFRVSNAVKQVNLNIIKIHGEMKDISSFASTFEVANSNKRVKEYEQEIYDNFEIIKDKFLGDQRIVEEAYNAFAGWKENRDEVIKLTLVGKRDEANKLTREKGAERVALINEKIIELSEVIDNNAVSFFNNAKEESNRNIYFLIVIQVVSGIIAVLVAFFTIKSIKKSLLQAVNMMKNLSEGECDLTQRLEINSNDELGEMAKWFNLFVEKIRNVVSEVVLNTNNLVQSSDTINHAMEQSNQGMEEVAISVNVISDGIQNTVSVTEETSASIQDLSNSAEIITQESESSYESTNNVLNAANFGAKLVKEVVGAIDKVKISSNQVAIVIDELKVSSDEIGQIVSIMTNISEQTNLLALNAAIEAARAGDAGRGFSVVAEEVKKLAEESKKSANKITELITKIQQKTNKTDTIIKEEQQLVEISVNKAYDTDSEFKKILEYIEEISQKIKMMAESSKQQALIAQDMSNTIDNLSQEVQINAGESEQISASVEEQVSTFEEIGASIENIKNISLSIKRQTDRFKI